MKFKTIADVRAANRTAGKFWFSPSTMRFFNSQIESGLYAGRYFITSERRELSHPKLYTIREVLPDGDIETVGEFQRFKFKFDAQQHARNLARALKNAA